MNTLEFLNLLYAGAENGHLYIWTKPDKATTWFKISDLARAATAAAKLSAGGKDVYFGVGLTAAAKFEGRAAVADIAVLPGLWFDLDIADAAHAQTALPADIDLARQLVDEFPLPPSILVHSGHGLHAYWLFREPWEISGERPRAINLLQRFQAQLRVQAAARGWKLDSTHDLARVLRLPGTQNRKSTPVPVRVLAADPAARYNPDDFDQYLPDDIPQPATGEGRAARFKRQPGDGPAARVFENCAFVRQFQDATRKRPEPEWVAAVTNLARCSDGHQVIHDIVRPFLGEKYSEKTTNEKIRHCLEEMHPQTCDYIRGALGYTGCPPEGCGVKSPCGWALAKKKRKAPELPTNIDLTTETYTDVGNANRFARMYRGRLLYCFHFGRWLIWDGKRWALDDTGQVMDYAKKCIRSMYKDAAGIENKNKRAALLAHAGRSETIARIKAMLELAEHMLAVRVEDLDAEQWLLNVNNGVIDLKTGQLLPHDSRRLITKLAPVDFTPFAGCPRFLQFLGEVFPQPAGDNIIPYIQRLAGYSLTGDTAEQKMAIAWGSGANGKSTLLNLLLDMLGDYAEMTPTETFLAKKNEGIPNDIARLRGARFVLASEAQEGRRLNEPLVKQVTGQDKLTARFLRQEFFSFQPAFKLVLLTNHKPLARGDDAALWRRIMLIPFTEKFEGDRRDPALPARLREELPGILKWAVEGCLDWQKAGLSPPAEVIQATNEYRSENDVLENWIEECCVVDHYSVAKTGELYRSLIEWASRSGEKIFLSHKSFGKKLVEKGFEPFKGTGGVRKMKGIGLLVSEPDNARDSWMQGQSYDSKRDPY